MMVGTGYYHMWDMIVTNSRLSTWHMHMMVGTGYYNMWEIIVTNNSRLGTSYYHMWNMPVIITRNMITYDSRNIIYAYPTYNSNLYLLHHMP